MSDGAPQSVRNPESWRTIIKDLLVAFKWPLVASVGLLLAVLAGGWSPDVQGFLDSLPPEFWAGVRYAVVGAIPGVVAAYALHRYFDSPSGYEVLDLHPVDDDHRHLRMGTDMYADLTVYDLRGNDVGKSSLTRCTVNGRPAFEVLYYDETANAAVTSWMGGASSAELRAYRKSVEYVTKVLSAEADKAIEVRANQMGIIRSVLAEVSNHMIATAERGSLPQGETIQHVIEETLDDAGLSNPLDGFEDAGIDMGNVISDSAGVSTSKESSSTESSSTESSSKERRNGSANGAARNGDGDEEGVLWTQNGGWQ